MPHADRATRLAYHREYRRRELEVTEAYRARVRARLLAKVTVDQAGCWIWRGTLNEHGYGNIGFRNHVRLTHRIAYELFVGPIPDGLTLDHLCNTPACCNPLHLKPATDRENILRGNGFSAQNARKTHCPKGHPYDETNTGHYRNSRYCRECARVKARAVHARKRAERGTVGA